MSTTINEMLKSLPKPKAIKPTKTDEGTGYLLGKKVLKSGEVKSITLRDKDNEVIVLRWLTADLDSTQKTTLRIAKEKALFAKIAVDVVKMKRRMCNAAKNSGIKMIDADVSKLTDFIHDQMGEGISALLKKSEPESAIPNF